MGEYSIEKIPELAEIVFLESIPSQTAKPQLPAKEMDSRLSAYIADAGMYQNGVAQLNTILMECWNVDGYGNRLTPIGTQRMRDVVQSMTGTDKTELQFWVDYNPDMCRFDIFTCNGEPAFRLCIVVPMEFNPKLALNPLAPGKGRGVYKLKPGLESSEYCTDKDEGAKATIELKGHDVAFVLKPEFMVRGVMSSDGWLEVPGDLRTLYLPAKDLEKVDSLENPGQMAM
eukprot:g1271.t1